MNVEDLELLLPPAPPAPLLVPKWGTVTQADPLRVQLAEDTAPADTTPKNLAGALAPGDVVWCFLQGKDLIVGGLLQRGSARGFSATLVTDSNGQALASGYNRLTTLVEDYDPWNAYNPATGFYTIPVSGWWDFTAGTTLGTASQRRFLMLEVGTAAAGSNTALVRSEGPATGYSAMSMARKGVRLTAGQQVSLVVYAAAALSGTNGIRGDFAPTYFTATLAW